MKRNLSLILAIMVLFCFTGCEGNFGSIDLRVPIAIGEDGVIKAGVLEQIKNENAIGVFTGSSGELNYEWTIFGSDIEKGKNISLDVALEENGENELRVTLGKGEAFGFSALLSVYLNETWAVDQATGYTDGRVFASVSVTGSKNTILNITLDGTVKEFVIRGEQTVEETTVESQGPEGEATETAPAEDDYLSKPQNGDHTVYNGGKDQYLTDPVPEGKPTPVEPEDQEVDKGKTLTCTFSIECSTILNNLDMLDPDKLEMVPSGGVILASTTVTFYEGESVYDVLQRVCKDNGIHMESSWTPIYNSAYVEGIHNLYEFDCGALSGWMYKVNGWYPNYGCSRYQLQEGDLVEWRYTCDLGHDVGGAYAVGG